MKLLPSATLGTPEVCHLVWEEEGKGLPDRTIRSATPHRSIPLAHTDTVAVVTKLTCAYPVEPKTADRPDADTSAQERKLIQSPLPLTSSRTTKISSSLVWVSEVKIEVLAGVGFLEAPGKHLPQAHYGCWPSLTPSYIASALSLLEPHTLSFPLMKTLVIGCKSNHIRSMV